MRLLGKDTDTTSLIGTEGKLPIYVSAFLSFVYVYDMYNVIIIIIIMCHL